MRIVGVGIGVLLASLDSFVLPLVKRIHDGTTSETYILVAMAVYALAPLIILWGMKYSSLTELNLTWDLLSDVLVTFIAIVLMREHVGLNTAFGIVFAFLAILLFVNEK
jgi:drug/metabolite transporter (DMT)-like permease